MAATATTDELRAHLAELETKFHESAGSGAAALSRAMMLVLERIAEAEAKAGEPTVEVDELQGRRGVAVATEQKRQWALQIGAIMRIWPAKVDAAFLQSELLCASEIVGNMRFSRSDRRFCPITTATPRKAQDA